MPLYSIVTDCFQDPVLCGNRLRVESSNRLRRIGVHRGFCRAYGAGDILCIAYPAFTRWANFYRAYGALLGGDVRRFNRNWRPNNFQPSNRDPEGSGGVPGAYGAGDIFRIGYFFEVIILS
jgi:hypothetical protein